ncbi:MAG: carboxypeptidase regulatory-like domain-containing protein [Gemmatimonadaceae bacterium]
MLAVRLNYIATLILLTPIALTAQSAGLISGTVVGSVGQQPLPYSTVSLEGVTQKRLTSPEGRFSFRVDSAGSYRLRIRQLGFAPLDTVVAFDGTSLQLTLVLRPVAFRLSDVRTVSGTPCSQRDDRDAFASGILEEVKKNAERELVLRNQYPFRYLLARGHATRRVNEGRYLTFRDTVAHTSGTTDRYQVGKIVRDRGPGNPSGREMRVPQLVDLADSVFLNSHCFSYGGTKRLGKRSVFQLDFTPARTLMTPDVEGSISIDTVGYTVQEAVFRLTNPEFVYPPILGLEVRTTYREIVPGLWLFDLISSTQPLPMTRVYDSQQFAVEMQKLIRLDFLRDAPSGISEFAIPLVKQEKDR